MISAKARCITRWHARNALALTLVSNQVARWHWHWHWQLSPFKKGSDPFLSLGGDWGRGRGMQYFRFQSGEVQV